MFRLSLATFIKLSKIMRSFYLTGIFSTSTVTSTDHVCCDRAIEGLTAVAFFCGDDGELDRAEGGGDLAPTGAGVSPA